MEEVRDVVDALDRFGLELYRVQAAEVETGARSGDRPRHLVGRVQQLLKHRPVSDVRLLVGEDRLEEVRLQPEDAGVVLRLVEVFVDEAGGAEGDDELGDELLELDEQTVVVEGLGVFHECGDELGEEVLVDGREVEHRADQDHPVDQVHLGYLPVPRQVEQEREVLKDLLLALQDHKLESRPQSREIRLLRSLPDLRVHDPLVFLNLVSRMLRSGAGSSRASSRSS